MCWCGVWVAISVCVGGGVRGLGAFFCSGGNIHPPKIIFNNSKRNVFNVFFCSGVSAFANLSN